MAAYTQCEFFLLRYVPDAVKDEFVNIGVVVRTAARAEVRFTTDYSRVLSLDPQVDLAWLASLERDLRSVVGERNESNETQLRKFAESFSNTVQLSSVKGLEAEDVAREADKLAQIYLETASQPGEGRTASIRQRIFSKMKTIFEQADLWRSFHKEIAAATYTHPGDQLKLDCGYPYRNGGENFKFFHAVAIESGTDTAKSLAFTWPALRDGIKAKEGKDSVILTAVVNDGLDPNDDRIGFAYAAFKRSEIQVATLTEISSYAERARRDLGI